MRCSFFALCLRCLPLLLANTFLSFKYTGILSKLLSPYRSEQHAAVRMGLADCIILPLLEQEIKVNIGAESPADLIRGVRQSLYMLDQDEGEVNTLNSCRSMRLS